MSYFIYLFQSLRASIIDFTDFAYFTEPETGRSVDEIHSSEQLDAAEAPSDENRRRLEEQTLVGRPSDQTERQKQGKTFKKTF